MWIVLEKSRRFGQNILDNQCGLFWASTEGSVRILWNIPALSDALLETFVHGYKYPRCFILQIPQPEH